MSQQKFVNRIKELKYLEEQYKQNNFSFFILYGKRRLGKTQLVLKFLNKYNGIYFLSSKEGDLNNIKSLQKEFSNFFNDELYNKFEITNWEDFFKIIVKIPSFIDFTKKKKLILILDEFPYLIEKNSAIPSIFQKIIDLNLQNQNIMLIILGSSQSIIENKVLTYKSPLYGRRTGSYLLGEMDFSHFKEFLPRFNFETQIKIWFIIGGVTQYLKLFSLEKSFFLAIKKHFLEKTSFLLNEADFLLKEEFRETKNYKIILKTISLGKNSSGEISNYTGFDKSLVSRYLEILKDLYIIKENKPLISKINSKNTKYLISDNYFNFWFKYIYPNKNLIEMEEYDLLLDLIKKDFNKFSEIKFEDFILKYFYNIDNAFYEYNKIFRQWGKYQKRVEIGDGRLERRTFTYEIDICGINEEKNKILFGECKWQENVDASKILRELKEKSQYVKWSGDMRKEIGDVGEGIVDDRIEEFVIFAKSFNEFRDRRLEIEEWRLENGENRVVSREIWEKENNCKLYDLKDLERVFKSKDLNS